METIAAFNRPAFLIPYRFAAARQPTVTRDVSLTGRAGISACAYAPNPSATAPAAANLLTRNIHPATKPTQGLRSRYAYSEVPPDSGITAASWAALRALQAAAVPAMMRPTKKA